MSNQAMCAINAASGLFYSDEDRYTEVVYSHLSELSNTKLLYLHLLLEDISGSCSFSKSLLTSIYTDCGCKISTQLISDVAALILSDRVLYSQYKSGTKDEQEYLDRCLVYIDSHKGFCSEIALYYDSYAGSIPDNLLKLVNSATLTTDLHIGNFSAKPSTQATPLTKAIGRTKGCRARVSELVIKELIEKIKVDRRFPMVLDFHMLREKTAAFADLSGSIPKILIRLPGNAKQSITFSVASSGVSALCGTGYTVVRSTISRPIGIFCNSDFELDSADIESAYEIIRYAITGYLENFGVLEVDNLEESINKTLNYLVEV